VPPSAWPIAPDPRAHAQTLRDSYDVDLDTGRLFSAREGVAEVLVSPRSRLIGRTASAGMTTSDENLVILAVRRGEEDGPNASRGTGVAGSLVLRAGDAMLVQGPWAALTRYTQSPDVIAVTLPRSCSAPFRSAGAPNGRSASWRRWSCCSRRDSCPPPWRDCWRPVHSC
jgi:hypothetical protein